MRLMILMATLLACGTSVAQAQSTRRPNARQGFWIGFGLGGGSAGIDCSSCTNERATGASGYIRLGGTLSRRILLGVEANGWLHSGGSAEPGELEVDESIGFGSFVVLWYPSPTGALYVKFGLGGMTYRQDDGLDELTAKAPSASIGIGYDVRVRRNTSLVLYVNSLVTSSVQQYRNGVPVANGNDFSLNLFQFGVGATWH